MRDKWRAFHIRPDTQLKVCSGLKISLRLELGHHIPFLPTTQTVLYSNIMDSLFKLGLIIITYNEELTTSRSLVAQSEAS